MSSEQPADRPGEVLIIDDTPANLHLLSNILTLKGYEVRAALGGQMGLLAAQTEPPEVILLDIFMPEINGYEVCQQLKANPRTQDIPIIFISAVGEIADKVKAFEAGGVDYITKPFHVAEVRSRVQTHLTMHRLQQQLQAQNERLQQAEAKYRSIFENCLEGIFQVTPQGHYLSANRALAGIYGYKSPALLMAVEHDINNGFYVRPGRRDELRSYLRRYGQVSEFESEVYRQDGSKIWISESVRAIYDATGELLYYEGTVQDITNQRQIETELRQQRHETERLLLSLLPQSIAERLKHKSASATIADSFDDATVLFADVVNFTRLSTEISPPELVELLNQIFSQFDRLTATYGLEKIKTVGDEYMVAGGLPVPKADHCTAIANMALDMQQAIAQFRSPDGSALQLRIGISTGPVVAGVIGKQKIAYDLWGNTVNLASRMESQGAPGKIQVCAATYEQLRTHYELQQRGVISIKGLGDQMTYWLKGRKSGAIA